MLPSEKNIARGSEQFIEIEEGISILSVKNDSEHEECITHNISADFIQFHFCVKGEIKFNFNEGSYALNIKEDSSLLLYNP
jgi:cell division protein YceG involved in septum cleavage